MVIECGCLTIDDNKGYRKYEFLSGETEVIDTGNVIEVLIMGNENQVIVNRCERIRSIRIDGNNNVLAVNCSVTTDELIVNGNTNYITFLRMPERFENNGTNNLIFNETAINEWRPETADVDEVLYTYSNSGRRSDYYLITNTIDVDKIYSCLRVDCAMSQVAPMSSASMVIKDPMGMEQYTIQLNGRDRITETRYLPFVLGVWEVQIEISSYGYSVDIEITGLANVIAGPRAP